MHPKLISIGSFYLPTYGVLVALGFLAALWVTLRLARRSGLNDETVTNLAIYCAITGLLGAKLTMFLFDWDFYSRNLGELFSFATLQAGGVFHGGLILALLFVGWFARRHKLSLLAVADVFAPGVALGHAIGRIGCFMAGCCWGVECTRPWAVTFTDPEAHRMMGVPLNIPLHPTQLYEAGVEAAIFGFLYWRFRRPHQTGEIIGLYLVLYGVARFLIEFVRSHEQELPFGLPLSLTQWIALALLMTGAALLMRGRRKEAYA